MTEIKNKCFKNGCNCFATHSLSAKGLESIQIFVCGEHMEQAKMQMPMMYLKLLIVKEL